MLISSIYIVRHGQSENNVLGISSTKWANKEQFGLTTYGINQIKKEAAKHKSFDLIIYSPFRRTKETAEQFALTSKCPLIEESLLKETDVGEFELQKYSVADSYLKKYGPDKPYPNGESYNQVKLRCQQVLKKLTKQYKGKIILIVTHGDLIDIFLKSFHPTINLSKYYKTYNNGRKVFKLI